MVRTRRHRPTDQQRSQATLLSGYGIPQREIAIMLRLDAKTLRKHYRHELDVGMIQANAAVAQSLYLMATRYKIPAAAIFWLKARAGWREKQDLTIDGTQTLQLAHLTAARSMSEQIHSHEIKGEAPPPEDEPDVPRDLMEPATE
jgi:hypothetical protein